jgi:hypothetical protein
MYPFTSCSTKARVDETPSAHIPIADQSNPSQVFSMKNGFPEE